MRHLLRYFIRGLLITVPIIATVWIIGTVFQWMDGLVGSILGHEVGIRLPGTTLRWSYGLGVLLTVTAITLVGVFTRNFIGRWFVRRIERLFSRVPVVKQIYSSIRDMVQAFVSEEKKFDKPVLLSFAAQPDVEVIGFVTRQTLEEFGRPDKVAVYVPQSYNFAANLILVPRERVTPISLPAGDVMAFVVSGGVSESTRPRIDGDD